MVIQVTRTGSCSLFWIFNNDIFCWIINGDLEFTCVWSKMDEPIGAGLQNYFPMYFWNLFIPHAIFGARSRNGLTIDRQGTACHDFSCTNLDDIHAHCDIFYNFCTIAAALYRNSHHEIIAPIEFLRCSCLHRSTPTHWSPIQWCPPEPKALIEWSNCRHHLMHSACDRRR